MTIHYHGTPITPNALLHKLAGRHFCVSFAAPQQIKIVHEVGQSVMLDNGAFSMWTSGKQPDWNAYYAWAEQWLAYPTTWAIIPDVIGGTEAENDALLGEWPHEAGTPVWHVNESIDRLKRLCDECQRVAIGSAGEYRVVGSDAWHRKMTASMNALCKTGRVPMWLHMLRGMATVGMGYPFSSVDSTDIARNHNRCNGDVISMANKWDGLQCNPTWEEIPQQMEMTA